MHDVKTLLDMENVVDMVVSCFAWKRYEMRFVSGFVARGLQLIFHQNLEPFICVTHT